MFKRYNIIYADPPWRYNDRGCNGNAESHYPTMAPKDICNLPIKLLAADDCVLFLWVTYPMLKGGLQVIDAWGFKYKSIAFQWVKTYPKNGEPFFGLGRWTRGNTEPCLLATKGKPQRIDNSVSQLVFHPIIRHSQKPPVIRDKIIQLLGELPRIELFARQAPEGWDVWGNEVESDLKWLLG